MSLALILVLLVAGAPETQSQDQPIQFRPMIGTVKSVDRDAMTFDLKTKSKTLTVSLSEKCSLRLLRRSTLAKVAEGSPVHILGQKKEVNWGSGVTVEMQKVEAIVAAKNFVAPPVPAKLIKQGFAWHAGNLTYEKAQNKYFIEQMTWVHVKKETVAYISEQVERKKLFDHLKKKRIVWVEAKTLEKKSAEAKKLVVFTERVPKNELPLLVDLGGKKRKKR